MTDSSEGSARRKRSSRLFMCVMVLVVVVLVAACIYLFIEYQKAVDKQPKSDPQRIAEITKRLGETVVLPDEQPTIATVADRAKLSEPQLAAQARDGDEILVYAKAKRVILYRPSLHKVVDMFRVDTSTTTAESEATTPSATTTKPQ